MVFNDNPIIYLTKKTWEYSKGNRGNVILYFSLFLIANIFDFMFPLLIGKILNIIQEFGITGDNIYGLLGYASMFILLSILFWMFHGPARVLENTNAFLVRANYRKYLLDGVMSLPAEWHADHHSGDTIDKIEKGTSALCDYSSESYQVIEIIVRFTSSYFALVYFNLHSAYLVIMMVFVVAFIIDKMDSILRIQWKQLSLAENEISAKVFDVISNITTVIILRVQKQLSKSIFKQIMKPLSLEIKTQKLNEFKWFIVSIFVSIMTFLILGTYIYSAFKSGSTVMLGTVYLLYGYVDRINELFYRMTWKYSNFVKLRVRVANAEEISKEFKKQFEIKNVKLEGWNKLIVSDLKFSYHKKKGVDLHLNNINMIINRGEKIALIGHSGSGKTTFMKIIRDLYHSKYGDIYLDDQKLEHGFKSISNNISLIPQDPEIFNTTIKENITLGVPLKTEEIEQYIKLAQFSEVVKRLPQKLNSYIYEKGVNLSGGEKQRLALSRGLMASRDKEIILLDESTSSVDTKNEYLIYQNIFKEFSDKTIFASIHRLHLLPMFDKIYLFKSGKIISSGSFEEMLSSKEFKKIWDKYVKNISRI
ncbi:ABC transporter ATP-binding protein [Candidatus Woesearchaeota archaeon]|nr:ABC transporter ATP-binding protein [Candidatus Woesearchaeota archaeon]